MQEENSSKYLSKITTKDFNVKDLRENDFLYFSRYFVKFFRDPPWNEWLMCPRCKGSDDFGPSYTWGSNIAFRRCPHCGTRLVLFWSPRRTEIYLKSHPSRLRMIYWGKQKAAWIWGYPVFPDEFYFDTVGLLYRFRKDPGVRVFVKVLQKYIEDLEEEGFKKFYTRTHKEALTVRYFLQYVLGFKEGEEDPQDPNRTYWYFKQKTHQ